MESTQAVSIVASWLKSGQALFLVIHLLGIAGFAYIIWQRLIPLARAQRDCRFDRPFPSGDYQGACNPWSRRWESWRE